METVDDLLLELRATGFTLHNLYERGPPRPDLVGDELIKHWNCRISREMPDQWRVYAYGTGDTAAASLRAALTDIARAMADHARPAIKATVYHHAAVRGLRKETVNVTLSDLGL